MLPSPQALAGAAPRRDAEPWAEDASAKELGATGRAGQGAARLKAPRFVSSEETPLDEQAEHRGLTPKQAEVLALVLTGTSVTRAARLVGGSRSTVYRWLEQSEAFRAMLNRGRQETRMMVQAQLGTLAQHAVSTIAQALLAGNERIGVKLLKGLGFLSGREPTIGNSDPEVLAGKRREQENLAAMLAELL